MKPLTKIEKRFAAAFGSSIDLNKLKPDRVRCVMTKIAYHEAGHFAARRFTTLELSHVIKISIIGNTDFSGYVMSERNFAAPFLESYPPPIKQSNGRMLLLMQLAGYGAEMLLDKSGEYDGIFDYYDFTYGDDWYGAREEGTDLFKAERIAKIMAKPFMPDYRILNLASKWTLKCCKYRPSGKWLRPLPIS